MNKTAITLAYFFLVLIGIIASVVILVYRPESIGILVSTLTTILGLGTVAAVQFSGLAKQNEKIERVQQQTNGTLSSKENEIARLRNLLSSNGIQPDPTTKTGATP